MQPTKGNPLAPSVVYARWVRALSPYQLHEVFLDGHYFESAKEAGRSWRLIAQLKSVQSRPTAGGGVRIEVPRRAGHGHGDW